MTKTRPVSEQNTYLVRFNRLMNPDQAFKLLQKAGAKKIIENQDQYFYGEENYFLAVTIATDEAFQAVSDISEVKDIIINEPVFC